MATNRTATQALAYAKQFVGNMNVDDADIKFRILNDASDMFHLYAPWSWSVAFLESQTLSDDTIDYAFTDPGDFLFFEKATLITVDPRVQDSDLTIVHTLPNDTTVKGIPSQISKVDATNYRVYPCPTNLTASKEPTLLTWYKKTNTNITSGNEGTASTLLFPDEWFHVYQQLVLLFAFQYTSDNRLGGVTVNNGQVQYSGQWGVVMGMLEQALRQEEPFTKAIGERV